MTKRYFVVIQKDSFDVVGITLCYEDLLRWNRRPFKGSNQWFSNFIGSAKNNAQQLASLKHPKYPHFTLSTRNRLDEFLKNSDVWISEIDSKHWSDIGVSSFNGYVTSDGEFDDVFHLDLEMNVNGNLTSVKNSTRRRNIKMSNSKILIEMNGREMTGTMGRGQWGALISIEGNNNIITINNYGNFDNIINYTDGEGRETACPFHIIGSRNIVIFNVLDNFKFRTGWMSSDSKNFLVGCSNDSNVVLVFAYEDAHFECGEGTTGDGWDHWYITNAKFVVGKFGNGKLTKVGKDYPT